MTEPPILLEGLLSIEAALRSASRPILTLCVRENHKDYAIAKLIKTAEAAGIPTFRVPEEEINLQAQGTTHGGVIAFVGERRYTPLELLTRGIKEAWIVMLDGVEDPYNYGQSIRAFYAAGAHGIVTRGRDWSRAAGTVARASAGASELMPTALVENVEDAAAALRNAGLKIVVADKRRAVPMYKADLRGGLFLIIGGEKRGVTRSFADSADARVSIPYGREFDQALGTTAAAAALAFEVLRQRTIKAE